jgi:hypothetical protein
VLSFFGLDARHLVGRQNALSCVSQRPSLLVERRDGGDLFIVDFKI